VRRLGDFECYRSITINCSCYFECNNVHDHEFCHRPAGLMALVKLLCKSETVQTAHEVQQTQLPPRCTAVLSNDASAQSARHMPEPTSCNQLPLLVCNATLQPRYRGPSRWNCSASCSAEPAGIARTQHHSFAHLLFSPAQCRATV